MSGWLLAAAMALWFGIWTSLTPCPLATNIAAISFIGKRVDSTRYVLLSGLVYTLGRVLAYVGLGIVLVGGMLSIPGVAGFLEKYMNKLLGPLLILLGMFLLELIQLNISVSVAGERLQKHAEKAGIWGVGLLGVIFALSFCPYSAWLFFYSLMGLAVKYQSRVLLPLLYGIGTGLPVVVFAALIAVGAQSVEKAYNKLTQIEKWIRRIAGVIFVLVGIFYCLTYIFGVFS